MISLQRAAHRTATLVTSVTDDELGNPTPCAEYTVGDLVDHLGAFAVSFHHAAIKDPVEPAGKGDASRLGPDWRERIPRDLERLAVDWAEPSAWEGMTRVGGIDLPGEVAGLVALQEVLIHGWDLAVATGQPADDDGPELEAVRELVARFADDPLVDGIFAAQVPVADDEPLLARVLGLAGRDPSWSRRDVVSKATS